jgi:hypothetical protein
MFDARRYSALISAAFTVLSGCATQPSEPVSVATADGCSWMHASYEIEGHSGSADFAVTRDAKLWVPLTANPSSLNPEVSAFRRADGELEVRMRTDGPSGGKEMRFIWLGPSPSSKPMAMYGEITRPRPHVEPGVAWPEYDLFPGVDVVGRVFVTCRPARARGMPSDWNSFAA